MQGPTTQPVRKALLWVLVAAQLLLPHQLNAGASPNSASRLLTGIELAFGGREVALDWPPFGPDDAYTVETRDTLLGPTAWVPGPASVWPQERASWMDPRLVHTGARFYRIVPSPKTAARGRLLAWSELPGYSAQQIQAIFAQLGVSVTAQNGVRLFKLTYETVNPFAVRTVASGLLVLPQGLIRPLPLLSYQHGTVVMRTEVPSALLGLETAVGVAFGGNGYVAALPDYVGLGDSPGLHPFVHARSEATATVDMLRATRALCASNSVPLNGQLFLIGYSEGGHATMAAHREIEAHHADEFTITASAPMAGPYDLSGVMADYFLSDSPMSNPYYFIYLLAAYQSIYHPVGSLAEILASPYDATLPSLLDGAHDGSDLNQAMGGSVPTKVLKPEFLAAFKSNPNHPLRLALRENDLYDWTPKARMRLYHCDGDRDVPYANSEVAYASFRQRGALQVDFKNPQAGADHGGCAIPALLDAKEWFDGLVVK